MPVLLESISTCYTDEAVTTHDGRALMHRAIRELILDVDREGAGLHTKLLMYRCPKVLQMTYGRASDKWTWEGTACEDRPGQSFQLTRIFKRGGKLAHGRVKPSGAMFALTIGKSVTGPSTCTPEAAVAPKVSKPKTKRGPDMMKKEQQ
jgi:hypothetical protein